MNQIRRMFSKIDFDPTKFVKVLGGVALLIIFGFMIYTGSVAILIIPIALIAAILVVLSPFLFDANVRKYISKSISKAFPAVVSGILFISGIGVLGLIGLVVFFGLIGLFGKALGD